MDLQMRNTALLSVARVVAAVLLAASLTQTATRAQSGSRAVPTADQILAKYEEALGGAAALSKVMTRTTRTRRIVDIGTPNDHYLLRHSKRGLGGVPLSIMNHGSLDGQFLFWLNGCDGKNGWQRGEKDAIRDFKTTTDGICEHEQAFYGYFVLDLPRMKRNFARFEVKGVHKIVPADAGHFGELAGGQGSDLFGPGARETYLVLGVPSGDDQKVWLYFDTQTGVLLRRTDAGTGAAPTPAGDPPRITDFIQYRNVGDGTRMPFQFVTVGENRVRGIHISVVDNEPIDDKVFIKPKVANRPDKGL